MKTSWKLGAALAALVVVAFVVPAAANHQPANKAAVSGSTLAHMSTPIVDGSTSEVVSLLAATVKTSSPTDLLFQVTMECGIWTDVTTVGNDDQSAEARVTVWIEMDGAPIGVVGGDDGKVVFCDRVHRQVTTLFDDEDATLRNYQESRSANAFNWMTLNAGSGLHRIEVKAQLEAKATNNGVAQAGIGKRTLLVSPEKLANDVVL